MKSLLSEIISRTQMWRCTEVLLMKTDGMLSLCFCETPLTNFSQEVLQMLLKFSYYCD
jgi:hypothetical protein